MNTIFKNSPKTILAFALVLSIGLSKRSIAQFDPMFTQYMFNEVFINPAFSGSHEALSLNALHRQQWVGIAGRPVTTTFTAHAPIVGNKMGLGVGLLNERIGVSNRTNVLLNYAYRLKLGSGSNLAFGLQGGAVQLNENLTNLVLNNTSDANFLTNTKSRLLPNFGFGAFYNTDKFYVGLSIPRMLENKVQVGSGGNKFTNSFNFKTFHYYLTGGYVFDLNSDVKLKPTVMLKFVEGAPVEFDVTANVLLREILWLGVAYRSGDAISGLIGYQFTPELRVGYSYDFTLTELQRYNSGSHEVNVSYIFRNKAKKVISPRLF